MLSTGWSIVNGALPALAALLVIGSIAIATIDVATQDLRLHAPFHPVRLATGLLLGWSGCVFMMGTLRRERG